MLLAEPGKSESDPRKIADIVIRLASMEEVPKRLVLGKDAGEFVKRFENERMEDAVKYRALTLSTGFTDATTTRS